LVHAALECFIFLTGADGSSQRAGRDGNMMPPDTFPLLPRLAGTDEKAILMRRLGSLTVRFGLTITTTLPSLVE
jgi:hypothetical protein